MYSSACYSSSCRKPYRKLQECLREHGGGEVGQIWFDGGDPLFLVNFHTKLALRKLLAGQSEVEKTLMTELQSRLQPMIEATCNINRAHQAYVCLPPLDKACSKDMAL